MTTHNTLRLKLTRDTHVPKYTSGLLTGSGLLVRTMECAWRNNNPFRSCIPLGNYRVMLDVGPDDVTHWLVINVPKRCPVELEVGVNYNSPNGNIVLQDSCAVDKINGDEPYIVRTSHQIDRLTEGLRSFTLEIVMKQPYTEYIAEHGYATPNSED